MSAPTLAGRRSAEDTPRAPARRVRPEVSAAVYVAAVVVLSACVGLAAPHLSKESGATLGWVAAVLGVAAVAVAAWAAWHLLGGVRRRWWLLALPLLLVAAYLGLWTVGQGVAAAFPAHPALGSRLPSDVGLDYRSVTLRTSDDVDLAAWWVPGDNGSAVVVLHGAGATRTSTLDQAQVLAGHGYGVLLVDARGHGESEGRGMEFGWYGDRDVAAAFDFLAGEPGVDADRLGVLGLSMGGEEAIGAAGADPRIRAVVAEGATNRVSADKAFLTAYGFRGHLQRGIDWGTYAVAGLLSPAPEPPSLRTSVRAAQADGTSTPLLLITAGAVDTERLAAERLDRAAPDAVDIWTVPGAGHTRGLRTDPDGWQQRVLAFLDDALSRSR